MKTLKEFAASVISSILGPNKSNKLIIDDDTTCFSICSLELLQKTVLQDPLSHLIEETLLDHHEFFGCSTLTLLAMWYFWSDEFQPIFENGYVIQDIIAYSQVALDVITTSISKISLSLNSLLQPMYSTSSKRKSFQKKRDFCDGLPAGVRYSSRHFSPVADDTFALQADKDADDLQEIDAGCADVVKKLDHGAESGISDLISECWKRQRRLTQNKKFQIDGLLVTPLNLPCSKAMVIDGLVLKSNFYASCCQRVKNSHSHRALVINGGVTFEYTHLGFAPKVAISVKKSLNNLIASNKEKWIKACCELILKLQVDALIVREDIDSAVADFCLSQSVLVLPHVPWYTLKILCHTAQCSPCAYILDCDKDCVIKDVVISEWKPSTFSLENQHFVFDFKLPLEVPLQTVVLCHPSPLMTSLMRHQIGHFMARLKSVTECGQLLPGGGKTEDYCHSLLSNLQSGDPQGVKSSVITGIANGFSRYSKAVLENQNLSTHNKAYDDLPSKLSAWKSAMQLVFLTQQCDMSIVNDVKNLSIL